MALAGTIDGMTTPAYSLLSTLLSAMGEVRCPRCRVVVPPFDAALAPSSVDYAGRVEVVVVHRRCSAPEG
jgi:hypothetical protein